MTGYIIGKPLPKLKSVKWKLVSCPTCSRDIQLAQWEETTPVFYGGCARCMISIYSTKESEDLVWNSEIDKRLRKRGKYKFPICINQVPFHMHFLVKDFDNQKAHEMIDLVFDFLRRYKKK